MKVGVLALQGDVREHLNSLGWLGVEAIPVRRLEELNEVSALILPGGESTTISKLAKTFGIFDELKKKISNGFPVYGSCAGMILLADRIVNGAENQETFGGIDMTVRRNAFGRQVHSFEDEIEFDSIGTFSAVFIRAPWVEEIGDGVEVLASIKGHPVAVRQGHLMATAFHPELTQDSKIHRYFLDFARV